MREIVKKQDKRSYRNTLMPWKGVGYVGEEKRNEMQRDG